jgi:hypothetical protein
MEIARHLRRQSEFSFDSGSPYLAAMIKAKRR